MGMAKIRTCVILLGGAFIISVLVARADSKVMPPNFSNSKPLELFSFEEASWLMESLHPDTALFEPKFVQEFLMDLKIQHERGKLEKRGLGQKPKCFDEISQLRTQIQAAMNIKCTLFVPGEQSANPDMPTECALPFKYKTGEDHYRNYFSCKRFEPHYDEFIPPSMFPRECPGGGHWCHFWCPTQVHNQTRVFDPQVHTFKDCHPRDCRGVERVCLSFSMRLCLFPFDYQSFQLQDPRPVKHRQCTNADADSTTGYWCPVSVSDEFNFDDCTPEDIIYSEKCDQSVSHCICENGNDLSEIVDLYEDTYQYDPGLQPI